MTLSNFHFINIANECYFLTQVEMAHQVLSKDMTELVSAMKLAQHYSTTTLDSVYQK